jgi:hypothetical protein
MSSRDCSAEKIASRTRSLVGRVPERGTASVSEPANPAIIRVIALNATGSLVVGLSEIQDIGQKSGRQAPGRRFR